jgi:excisionase family DNA binding protein
MYSIEMKKLIKKQATNQRLILKFTENLFEIQKQIAELNYQEIRKNKAKDKKSNSDFLTLKEVCKLLDVSKATLYRMRLEGFPYQKIGNGKKIIFSEKAIKEYMKNQK